MTSDAGVASPCTDVCRMDASTGLCEGCLRTIDEIVAWSSMNEDAKRAVWVQLASRSIDGVGREADTSSRAAPPGTSP